MKKLLVLVMVLAMCLALTACGDIENFEENLEAGYSVSELSDSMMSSYALLMSADMDDFDVQNTFMPPIR